MVTKNTKPETATEEYSADQILTIDPVSYITKRPSLYLGPHERMQLVSLREPIDNGIDEFRAGHGKEVKIIINPDGSAEIQDSGRGVPVGINKQTGENGIFMAFGKVGSGGKFGASDSGYGGTASLGTNGVGTTATNATSLRFDTIVYKDGKIHRLSFKNGKPGHYDDDTGPNSKFTSSMDIKTFKDDRTAAEKKKRPSGTTIRFWPNPAIFGEDSSYRIPELREILRSSAFLIPGLKIVIDDRTPGQEQLDEFEFDGGLVDMLEAYSDDKPLHDPIHIETMGFFKEIAPVPQSDGSIKSMEIERDVKVNVVLQWGEGYETNIRSYVNTIYTSLGGVHVQGLERALSKVFVDNIKNARGLLKAKEEPPILADIVEGLTAIISIEQNEAKFTSQDKTKLSGAETSKVVSASLISAFKEWSNNKKHANQVKLINSKIVEASRIRLAARQQKDTARKKSALEASSSMPAKLVDCGDVSSPYSELFLVEGDSALGTMRSARDARFQALFPLRGKILNVQKATTASMLGNAECAAIIQVLGAGSGRTFNLEERRYSKIILAADADVDGSHIRVLLITFFWKYMRDFVEAGLLYSVIPPLFAVKTHGKGSEVFYAADQKELDSITKKLDAKKQRYEVGRNKGLGEMDSEPTWDTLMDPENRRLKQITIRDVEKASEMLELAMGDKVPPRKDWITDNRNKLSALDLDG